jgi:hypothetical protein
VPKAFRCYVPKELSPEDVAQHLLNDLSNKSYIPKENLVLLNLRNGKICNDSQFGSSKHCIYQLEEIQKEKEQKICVVNILWQENPVRIPMVFRCCEKKVCIFYLLVSHKIDYSNKFPKNSKSETKSPLDECLILYIL